MKRVLLVAAAAAGVVALRRRLKAAEAERALWATVTDPPPADGGEPAGPRPGPEPGDGLA